MNHRDPAQSADQEHLRKHPPKDLNISIEKMFKTAWL